jgi:hypothetical protein
MTDPLLRVYLDPEEIAPDGYPHVWRKPGWERLIEEGAAKTLVEEQAAKTIEFIRTIGGLPETPKYQPIKDLIREQAGYRCERCHHPYPPGITKTCPKGEWTPCDEQCEHAGPFRTRETMREDEWREYDGPGIPFPSEAMYDFDQNGRRVQRWEYEARWRILTTHHLNGIKHDCRWWNLAALCQRCHLQIQGKVNMDRIWPWEHSEWFKPHAAGWYAFAYLGEELSREETMERLDELLDLEQDRKAKRFGGWVIAPQGEMRQDDGYDRSK